MYQSILIPTDGSDASRRAIRAGVALAQTLHAEIHAVTVTPTFHYFTLEASQLEQSETEFEADSSRRATRLLEEVSEAAREAGVACSCHHMVSDHPFEAIISTARDKQCDLINMASRGQRGLKGLLLGSQTQRVLTHCDIPVLVQH